MSHELLIARADRAPQRIPLKDAVTLLGRSHSNNLCFPDDASLSRKHLKLTIDDEGVWAEDLGSKNGTLLNGRRLTSREAVQAGDRLALGQITVTLVGEGEEVEDDGIFERDSGPINASATVMTSLEGLLSEQTGPVMVSGEQMAATGGAQTGSALDSPGFRVMMRASRELVGQRPLEELFPLILEMSIEAVGAERGLLMVLEGGRLVTKATHGEGFRISTTVRDKVMNEKASILVQDIASHEAFSQQQSISAQSIHTMMAVPLQTEQRVIGLLYVDSRLLVREFNQDDLNLLTILGNVAAIRIEQERFMAMERENRQAAKIQKGILPDQPPKVAGVDVAGFNEPCFSVGGDYYDFFPYSDGRIGLVLGDVAGKGISAALLMSNLQARVQILAEQITSPAEMVGKLDKSIAGNTPSNRFITFFFGIFDPGTGELIYTNAGHNPPLIVRSDGSVEALATSGTVLGMLPELGYTEERARLDVGDLLAIFSDGVTEATDGESDEEFGEDRLADILKAHRETEAATLVDTTIGELGKWTRAAPAEDDITLVIARRVQ